MHKFRAVDRLGDYFFYGGAWYYQQIIAAFFYVRTYRNVCQFTCTE